MKRTVSILVGAAIGCAVVGLCFMLGAALLAFNSCGLDTRPRVTTWAPRPTVVLRDEDGGR